jgi:hypothetical protein
MNEQELIPLHVIEAVLKRLELAGDLKQETSSLVRAVRQGIQTEMEGVVISQSVKRAEILK